MISADTYVLEKSYNPKITDFHFENKQIKAIQDCNQGSYVSGEVIYDLSVLRNMDSLADFSNGFFYIPIVMHLQSSVDLRPSVSNAFAMSLKKRASSITPQFNS